jgi:phosphoribosylformylglycinamidine cyclo-ligase
MLSFEEIVCDLSGHENQLAKSLLELKKAQNQSAGSHPFKSDFWEKYDDPILVSSTRCLTQKLHFGQLWSSMAGLGAELVGLCANEMAAQGADCWFFQPFVGGQKGEAPVWGRLLGGMTKACEAINCTLIANDDDATPHGITGFMVGIVEKRQAMSTEHIGVGDHILGLGANGLHGSGYHLVRKIMLDMLNHRPHDVLWQTGQGVVTVADEIMRPTRSYQKTLRTLLRHGLRPQYMHHVGESGLLGGLKSMLPPGTSASIELKKIKTLPIFSYLQERGQLSDVEMLSHFNLGVGVVLVVPASEVDKFTDNLLALGEKVYALGSIEKGDGGVSF